MFRPPCSLSFQSDMEYLQLLRCEDPRPWVSVVRMRGGSSSSSPEYSHLWDQVWHGLKMTPSNDKSDELKYCSGKSKYEAWLDWTFAIIKKNKIFNLGIGDKRENSQGHRMSRHWNELQQSKHYRQVINILFFLLHLISSWMAQVINTINPFWKHARTFSKAWNRFNTKYSLPFSLSIHNYEWHLCV